MFNTLEEIFNKYNYNIHLIELKTNDVMKNHWNGNYYRDIEKDYKKMKYYYLTAIEEDYINSMNNLAIYYEEIEKNYLKMKYYYLTAIEKGSKDSMNNLANYYREIEKDYEKMKQYYLMAIEKGDVNSMINLANYYEQNFFKKRKFIDI
jgi:TPR repeat protein